MVRHLAHRVDLLHAILAQLDLAGEEIHALVLVQRAVHERRLHHALLSLRGLQQALGEACSRHRHRQSRGPGTVLGLDDLVPAELDAVDEVIEGFAGEVGVVGLREEGHDGDAGVATDDGDGLVGGIGVLDLGEEAGGADDVEGGDAEKAFGIIDALGLENFGADGNGRVDLGWGG